MNPPVADPLSFMDESDRPAREAAAKSLAAYVSKSHGVRAFPAAVQKLLSSTSSKNFDPRKATATIESDSSLAARILRVVNSPSFALRMRCRKIQTAVTLLGPRRLGQIASAAAVLDMFSDDSPAVSEIFRHSSGTAVIARHLAPRAGLAPDELFTCGLLHDFGKLMLVQSGDDSYGEVLTTGAQNADVADVEERRRYGFDHATLGAIMFASWNIPEPVPQVVAWHHQPDRAFMVGGTIGKMVATLRWAETLAHAFERGETIDEEWVAALAKHDSVVFLGAANTCLERLCRDLQKKWLESQKTSMLEEAPDEDAADDDEEDVREAARAVESVPSEPPPRKVVPPPLPQTESPPESPLESPPIIEPPHIDVGSFVTAALQKITSLKPADGEGVDSTQNVSKRPEPSASGEPVSHPITPISLPEEVPSRPRTYHPPVPLVSGGGGGKPKLHAAGVVAALSLVSATVLWAFLPQWTRVSLFFWVLAFVSLVVGLARRRTAEA